jgi:hypothetical protein
MKEKKKKKKQERTKENPKKTMERVQYHLRNFARQKIQALNKREMQSPTLYERPKNKHPNTHPGSIRSSGANGVLKR